MNIILLLIDEKEKEDIFHNQNASNQMILFLYNIKRLYLYLFYKLSEIYRNNRLFILYYKLITICQDLFYKKNYRRILL